jgi:glyoxylase-like metal-dependent hydrolase (beta-lactamase superfamily II)
VARRPSIWCLGDASGGHVRAYLVQEGKRFTLVDTLFELDAVLVKTKLRELGYPASSLKRIVLTHGHRAHLGGLAELKRWSGARVYAHEWEADVIAGERKAVRVSMRPKRPLSIWWRYTWWPWQVGLARGWGPHPGCPVDEPLTDGSMVGSLEVHHTPGHTPGHLSLYCHERRFLIAGDLIATWPVISAGWPAFTLNEKELRVSLGRLAALAPAIVGVGHGDPITEDAADRVRSLVA